MPARVPKYGLEAFCKACGDGDLEQLQTMLDREDPIGGFQGDINEHHSSYNALHFAAVNGQLECVEALMRAGADPHVKTRMPYGSNPADGRTAAELADDWGWDDVAAVLKTAQADIPKGDYLAGGPLNNAKIYPSILTATGRDPAEVRRVSAKLSGMARPYFREEREMKTSVALLFPGEGSQYVGMLKDVKDKPSVASMLQSARQILGFDLAEVCVTGPSSKLEDPAVFQPALFLAGAAALESLRGLHGDAAAKPGAVAGFGAGELTALLAAGVMSFEDGLRVAKAAGEALKKAAAGSPQALLSIAGLRRSKLEGFCNTIQSEGGPKAVCAVAAELFPKGATCGGTKPLVEKLAKLVKDNGALQARIAEGAAFHTPLMAPAVAEVKAVLDEAASRMKPPTCDVYMNSTGTPVFAGTSPKELLPLLLRQLVEPVLWESCIKNMVKAGVKDFYEVGPRSQLKAIMKRIDAVAFERTTSVEV